MPLVPDVPLLDLPLVPDEPAPAQRPLALHGAAQHSVSVAHDEPGPTHATGGALSMLASFAALTAPHSPSRQKLPCTQSASTEHVPTFLLHATTTTIPPSAAKRAVTRATTGKA